MSLIQIDRETAQTLLNLTIRLEYFAEANRLRAALDAQQTANTAETPRVIALHRALPMSGPFGLAESYDAMRRLAETLEREGNQLRALDAQQTQSPTRPYVDALANEMERKLALNRHKGDRDGWLRCGIKMLWEILLGEVEELREAAAQSDTRATFSEAADVANLAMMVADAHSQGQRLAALAAPQPDPREAFENVAKDYNLDLTRLGDRYASVETQMRWRWFIAGFAAGRGR